ncbi:MULTISPECIES: hypothetical protein [Streptomyces]|uniref:Secreted protein n=1 Tax=Streptomyces tsukubensis (strain DSM 42081 / NBRC 108919 / NRRL 18488 / 9993) TaxID=1114943 RepID=A0A7G3UBL6_STRT9|nr:MULTISPECIES: hypothetical protein [Streptomyces]AZK96171.1 hypothetical protein B7R87_21605 [Streptomyces tsukubensis]MYS68611.1 hypothetical protein [Streptomyces sp. SID5473]QKM67814.1 hypothetical protein STSU_012180 [Streptomyces tsukubensis NRRL18488]TAI44211.1 hypothetical protein EWI31_11980 [Streptomyces tsukubensis]
MKYSSRVAVIIAGSVAAVGAAAPAMAATAAPPAMPPMSLNGGLTHIVEQSPLLNGGSGNVVKDAAETAMQLNSIKGQAPERILKTAAGATPMLGGISVGG